jgi:ABC-type glutathione transport system ATPase component
MLEAKNLSKSYFVKDGQKGFKTKELKAVRDASLVLRPGKTVGLVGESGCGKSTLSRMLLLLEKPSAGEIWFESKPVLTRNKEQLQQYRRSVQIVFQDPMNAMNPRMSVEEIIREPFRVHPDAEPENLKARISELLNDVGLNETLRLRYPHELSGGERQRVCIARAIALKPRYLICDEAVSSLDVLVQAQILNLFLKLQKEHHFAYLFISHDLRVVRHMSDEVYVMNQGQIIEQGPADQIYKHPQDSYTRNLLSSIHLNDLK